MERIKEIEERLTQIKAELEGECDLEALEKETNALMEERAALIENAEKREKLVNEVTSFVPKADEVIKPQEDVKMERFAVDSKEYRNLWLKNLQGTLTADEARDYAASNVGGAIPTISSDLFFNKLVKLAPMLSEITLLRVAGNVSFTVDGVRNDAVQHTENAAITAATDTLVKVTLGGYEFVKLLYISKTVETMAIDAFEDWLFEMIAEDVAAKIEDAIINGDGSDEPKGIAYATTFTSGVNYVEVTGTTKITYSDITDAIAMLPARYEGNAKFLCGKGFAWKVFATISDQQKRPIFIQDATEAHRYQVLGFPVIVSDKVADKACYLGDFRKLMVGNLSKDIEVEKSAEAGFSSNSIAFKGDAIFDCKPAATDAVVKITVANY